MEPIYTINSDEEISDEEVSDECESGTDDEADCELQFNDGSAAVESYIRNQFNMKSNYESGIKTAKQPKNTDKSENGDIVRDMPHAEERAIRALEKAKNKHAEPAVGMDADTEASYFDSVVDDSSHIDGDISMFSELSLSRSLLRAVEYCGYVNPTPVQAKVIPYALAGRDICASAVTGSGKTAAFVLPFLERLLFRPRDVSAIRVLIVTPTRELATQIYSVLLKLAQFTDITCSLILGGKKDVRSQETALRNRPDVVVCTPGRIIDHLRNTPSFTLDDMDVLVLDEVDRLLELGFKDELEEIVKYCPLSRQTMLFSATMTSGVDDLAKLSLKKPVRVKTQGDATTVAPRLVQEFLRLRSEGDREAMLAALVCRTFNKRAIVFFETKRDAHRFFILCSVLDEDLKVCELHGDMSQPQREFALQQFVRGECEVMIATDVAARGLDISSVQTVINAEMPRSTSVYVHRVGRTARAGKAGRSVTIVSDGRRKVMKDLLKSDLVAAGADGATPGQTVLSRTIPHAVISHYIGKIASLEDNISVFYRDEKMKSKTDIALREAERAENMLLHEDDIHSRPARTWYQTETQKQAIRDASRAEAEAISQSKVSLVDQVNQMALRDDYRNEIGPTKESHRMSRKKRRRIQALEDVEPEDTKTSSAIKRVKMASRDKKEVQKEKTMAEMAVKKGVKNEKIRRPVFAVGGLDQDMLDWNGGGSGGKINRKAAERESRESKFTDFDPNKKLRKGGKLGKQSFKSKSKFKRRN